MSVSKEAVIANLKQELIVVENEKATDLLLLTLDPGTSDTKIVFRTAWSGGHCSKPNLLLMGSHLALVSSSSIQAYESKRITSPNPEDEAWVETEGNHYAVGFFAQKQYDTCVPLEGLKWEGAIPKILAATGALAEREGLPNEFALALALPLPYSEWEDRKTLEREVTKALSHFSFRGRTLSVEVKFFLCIPEGGGHALTRGKKLGASFNQKKIVSLMFGLRDISAVQFERGVITGTSKRLGMAKLVNMVLDQTSGLDFHPLLIAIHQAGRNPTPAKFEHLVETRKENLKAEKSAKIAEAVRSARAEYWLRVQRWLSQVIPADVDEVIMGGGTADYLKAELKAFFSRNYKGVTLSWSADLVTDVQHIFNLPQKKDALGTRLTDPYGLSRYLQQKVFPQLGSTKVPTSTRMTKV